jgi:hypothetical protein
VTQVTFDAGDLACRGYDNYHTRTISLEEALAQTKRNN